VSDVTIEDSAMEKGGVAKEMPSYEVKMEMFDPNNIL
jgi:hypothetical protein